MSNPYFQFKKFTIWHDKCAMKVGTDSVLLGAWAPFIGNTALDVGCGTGILSIMLAGRSELDIHALDIDADAVSQTLENAAATPWKDRITAETADFCKWKDERVFDTILSNPPFYESQTLPPEKARMKARNTQSLSYGDLICQVARRLSPKGLFSMVLPASEERTLRGLAVEYGLHPVKSLKVTTVEGKVPKRLLITFTPESISLQEEQRCLCIHDASGAFTDEYKRLVGDYYLKV